MAAVDAYRSSQLHHSKHAMRQRPTRTASSVGQQKATPREAGMAFGCGAKHQRNFFVLLHPLFDHVEGSRRGGLAALYRAGASGYTL